MSDTTENEIAEAVLKVLSAIPSGDATLAHLRKRVPDHVSLTTNDLTPSVTRPGEAIWEQRLRNIKSHHKTPGNFIADGYLTAPSKGRLRITEQGRKRLSPKRSEL